jgi:threonyl-tRNA synthetase
VQARVLPITDRNLDFAHQVRERLQHVGLRVEVDESQGTLNSKVRDAEVMKIPYMLVVGDREAEQDAVAVRHRDQGDLGPEPVEEFLLRLSEEAQPPQLL